MVLPGERAMQGLSAVAVAAVLWGLGCGPDYPKCDTDSDCHTGEFCVNGLCQQCRGDQDCPAGQTCASGACQAVPGYCTSSSDCGPGMECQNNQCVAVSESSAPPPPNPPSSGACSLDAIYFDFDSATL